MAKKSHSPVRRSHRTKRPKVGTGAPPRLNVTPLQVWGGSTAAFLCLNLGTIEAEFAKNLRRLGSRRAQAADAAAELTNEFVSAFTEVIERRLNFDLTTGALGFQMLRFEHRTEFLEQRLDGALSTLNALVLRPSWLPELLAMPITRVVREQIQKRGTPRQRQALKHLLAPATRAKGGRPFSLPENRADVALRKAIEAARRRLEAGVERAEKIRRAGRDHEEIRPALKSMGYGPSETEAIVRGRGNAAQHFVARKRELSLASVRSISWRGKQYLD